MNYLNKLSALLFIVVLLFSACRKENIDIVIPEEPIYIPAEVEVNTLVSALKVTSTTGCELECISINYPFQFSLESGDSSLITSEAELIAALNAVAPNRVVDFVFPLDAVDVDGNAIVINDNNELGTIFASCIPDTGWNNSPSDGGVPAFLLEDLCLDLVYPVNLIDALENTYTATNQAEIVNLKATVPNLFFSFPLTVEDDQGVQTILADMNEFFDALYDCPGITPPSTGSGNGVTINGFGCNELQYPVDVVLTDGTAVTVVDANQYANMVLGGQHLEIQYPFSLTDPDGNILLITNEADLSDAFSACGGNILPGDCATVPSHILVFFNQGFGPANCNYEVIFPTDVEKDGITYILADDFEYLDLYNDTYDMYGNPGAPINIIYPIEVQTNNGIVTLNTDIEVCNFMDTNCP